MNKEILKSMRKAIKQNNLDLVKSLIIANEELINIDTVFGSWLHVASAQGKFLIASYLIECGLDVNKNGDISGGTPLRSADENGHLDVVELLYQNGAKFDVSEAIKNPLFGAIYGGYHDIVKFLVENGIDITVQYSIGKLDNVDAYEYSRQLGQTKIANYLKEKIGNDRV